MKIICVVRRLYERPNEPGFDNDRYLMIIDNPFTFNQQVGHIHECLADVTVCRNNLHMRYKQLVATVSLSQPRFYKKSFVTNKNVFYGVCYNKTQRCDIHTKLFLHIKLYVESSLLRECRLSSVLLFIVAAVIYGCVDF